MNNDTKIAIKVWLIDKSKKLRKIAFNSSFFILGSMLISLVYSAIVHGSLTLRYIFPSAFLTGAVVTFAGVLIVLLPIRASFKSKYNSDKVVDHSNYFSLTMERREKKRIFAHSLIYLGMCIIVMTALTQQLLALIFRLLS